MPASRRIEVLREDGTAELVVDNSDAIASSAEDSLPGPLPTTPVLDPPRPSRRHRLPVDAWPPPMRANMPVDSSISGSGWADYIDVVSFRWVRARVCARAMNAGVGGCRPRRTPMGRGEIIALTVAFPCDETAGCD